MSMTMTYLPIFVKCNKDSSVLNIRRRPFGQQTVFHNSRQLLGACQLTVTRQSSYKMKWNPNAHRQSLRELSSFDFRLYWCQCELMRDIKWGENIHMYWSILSWMYWVRRPMTPSSWSCHLYFWKLYVFIAFQSFLSSFIKVIYSNIFDGINFK